MKGTLEVMTPTVFLWIKRLLVLAAICFVVFAGWFYHTFINDPFDDWWFDQKIWKAENNIAFDNPRGRMAYDLRHRVLKPKMTRKQVLALLGPPDAGESKTSLSYNLGAWSGFGMDPDFFAVEFDKSGRLVKAYWFST
jgi:hypothetical protein